MYNLSNTKSLEIIDNQDIKNTLNKSFIFNADKTPTAVKTAINRIYRLSENEVANIIITKEYDILKPTDTIYSLPSELPNWIVNTRTINTVQKYILTLNSSSNKFSEIIAIKYSPTYLKDYLTFATEFNTNTGELTITGITKETTQANYGANNGIIIYTQYESIELKGLNIANYQE